MQNTDPLQRHTRRGSWATRPLKRLAHAARKAGPYVMIEVLLPGGTLIALLLWLSQRGRLRLGLRHLRAPGAPTTMAQAAPRTHGFFSPAITTAAR
jgi:hypothetical protein